jgi:transcriptional regulator with XRE-family HTH domain
LRGGRSAGKIEESAAGSTGLIVRATVSGRIAPTLWQRELGKLLGTLRAERKLTIEEVAEKLLCPPDRIRELEAAADLPTEGNIRDLRTLFKLDDPASDRLTELAREAKRQGWWAKYEDLGVPYIGLEEHASAITTYTMHYFPALLQTGEYARAIIKATDPRIEPRILSQRVEARLRRQRVLDRKTLRRYEVLLDEAVLHHPVGGRLVMSEQLDKVLTAAQKSNVEILILPFDRGTAVAQDSNFVLLHFDQPELSPVVCIEGLTAFPVLEDKEDVDRYLETEGHLRQSALSVDDSIRRITQARDTYRDN